MDLSNTYVAFAGWIFVASYSSRRCETCCAENNFAHHQIEIAIQLLRETIFRVVLVILMQTSKHLN